MGVVITKVRVAKDGTLSGRVPANVPAGEHEAAINVESPSKAFNLNCLPTIDLGPWPANLGLRRKEIYDQDGR